LTLVLLSLMVAAGVVSATTGYSIGREALKGVTQPDTRPGSALSDTETMPPRHEGMALKKEADILANVEARMKTGTTAPQTPQSPQSSITPLTTEPSTAVVETVSTTSSQFPLVSQADGVVFQVLSVRPDGESLVMDVSLQNTSDRPVQFFYSFLNVSDNLGRTFSASTNGLPGNVPADGQVFNGTVSIPAGLLDNATELGLYLADYPDQTLKLQLAGIPVVR
jgi:hypothetical protein